MMSWIHKSPFGSHDDPVQHILDLLAKEADRAGVLLSDAERSVLIAKSNPEEPISEELRAKTTNLITLVLDHEADIDDPKSLGNSLAWASNDKYTNVAALAEGVIFQGAKAPLAYMGESGSSIECSSLAAVF
jgi:hypothetical protein